MDKDKALDLALEALEMLAKWEHPASNITTKTRRIYPHRVAVDAADTLRAAIEQAEKQEPVGYLYSWIHSSATGKPDETYTSFAETLEQATRHEAHFDIRPVYTTPPAAQRQWVGLTDEEILELLCIHSDDPEDWEFEMKEVRAIEAKLKEKNESHRQHVTDGSPCWCEPETSYTDPETGASVIVHKEPQ